MEIRVIGDDIELDGFLAGRIDRSLPPSKRDELEAALSRLMEPGKGETCPACGRVVEEG